MQAQGFRKRRFQEVLLVCAVPWILTPACKAKFFKVEALMQMQRQVHASSINVRPRSSGMHTLLATSVNQWTGLPPVVKPRLQATSPQAVLILIMRIRRENVLETPDSSVRRLRYSISMSQGVPTTIDTVVQAWLQGMNPQAVQFLVVRIRRENVLEDALNTIAVASPDALKKPLRIIFSSGVAGTGAKGFS